MILSMIDELAALDAYFPGKDQDDRLAAIRYTRARVDASRVGILPTHLRAPWQFLGTAYRDFLSMMTNDKADK